MKKWFICFGLMVLLTACGGGKDQEISEGIQAGETTAEVVDGHDEPTEREVAESAGEPGTDESATSSGAEEGSQPDEPEAADESDMPLPEQPEDLVFEVFEVTEGGFSFAAPAGYKVTIDGVEAEMVAPDADPEYGPQFFIAGGPLDGVTTDIMVDFMVSGLRDEQGFNVGELESVLVNGLEGYAADYDGLDGDVALQGRIIVVGDDAQAVMLFGGGPADLWASTTAAEFDQLASSVHLMDLAAAETTAGADKAEKPAATAGGEAIVIDPSAAGFACFSTEDAAVSCLMADGSWQYFDDETSPLGGNRVAAMAVCPDGTLLMGHLFGISAFDGSDWREYIDDWGTGSIEAMACDPSGNIWIAHFQGVSTFNGSSWETFGSELLEGNDDPSGLVHDVTAAADGTIWAVTSNTFASFNGSDWTVYDEATLGDLYFFEAVVMGTDGRPRVVHSDGVLISTDGEWVSSEGDFFSAEAAAVDAENNVWIGTFSDGLYQLSGGSWGYEGLSTSLSSDRINAVTIDAAGRIWVGSDYGLNVFDGAGWQVFRMDNSDLSDNEIRAIAVVGAGPMLPETAEEPAGSMIGSLTLDGDPYAGALVEICVESLSGYFDGDTPCSGQPVFVSATTADDGTFVMADVPEGFYVITAETPDGWARLTTEYGFGSERVPVLAGEETDIGELIITSGNE